MKLRSLFASAAILLLALAPAIAEKDQGEKIAEKKKDEDKSVGPMFAFVCLNNQKPATEAAWKKSLKKWLALKSEDEIKEFEIETDLKGKKKDSPKGWSVSFEVDEKVFVVGQIGAPVPKEDIDYACMNSIMWPEAKKVMAKHTSHLVVMAMGEYKTPCARALALSRVIAASTEIHETAGVYWGHAATVHSPKMFRKLMTGAKETMADIPSFLWVGFLREAGDDEGTVNFYTRGLAEFGAKELEVINSKKKPSDIFVMLGDLTTYLVMKGDVIKDGDTIGNTETEKIKTRWVDSHIGLEGKVIRIDY